MSEDRPGSGDEGAHDSRAGRRFLNPWVLATLAGLVLIPAIRPLLRFEPDPPPVLRQLPEWRLVDQNGEPFGSAELAGEVWVGSFLFTRCAIVCPRLTASLDQLQRRYAEEGVDGVRLVSFTVDPANDTPERLREYARSRGLDLSRWRLVTGAEQDVRALIEGGFDLPMGERLDLAGGVIDVAHTSRLVLVDRRGGVRGHYASDSAVGLDEVFHRTRQILAE